MPKFFSPGMWPGNSRDLNPVDYCIWNMMQKRTKYQSGIRTSCGSESGSGWLRQTLAEFQHSVVDDAVDQWRKTSGYATMVHGRGCNPHRCTTTFANVEITSL